MSVLERVVKLELPPEDGDAADTSAALSSSSKSLQPNPADVGPTSTPVPLPETDDFYEENIYETLND